MKEDIIYIEQFLAGDMEGFEMLVRKYQNRVLNIVYSLVGKDRESEDILQEAFLKVYNNLNSFSRRSSFSTWLYRIVVNTTYDFLRRRKNFISDDIVMGKIAAVNDGPVAVLLKKEKETMIAKALENVPFKYRTAVVLKDIEGLGYSDIARILRCSIGTVESRIYRARQFLREELLRHGGEAI